MQRRTRRGNTIKNLLGLLLVLALVILGFTLLYRFAAWGLRLVAGVPFLGKLVSAESSKGIDTFKLSLGGLFCWRVVVNPRKGTIAGTIQIDSARRWGPLAVVAALGGAFVVPSISGLLMPAALIAVAVGLAMRMFRDEQRPASAEGSRSSEAGSKAAPGQGRS